MRRRRGTCPAQTREQTLRELDDGEDTERTAGSTCLNPVGGGGAVGRLLQKLLGNSRSKGKGTPGAEAPTHRSRHGGRVGRGATVSSSRAELPDDVEGFSRGRSPIPSGTSFSGGTDTTGARSPRSSRPSSAIRVAAESGVRPRSDGPWPASVSTSSAVDVSPRATTSTSTRRSRLAWSSRRVRRRTRRSTSTACGRRRELSVLDPARHLGLGRRAERFGRVGPRPPARGGVGADHGAARARRPCRALRLSFAGPNRSAGGAGQAIRRPVRRAEPAPHERPRCRAAYTRMGAAIRHGSSVLEEQGGTVRRLLVVLSDGFAYDHSYEGDYAEADARRALAEARRRGTACLCLSIGAGTDAESLRRVFGTAAHASFIRSRVSSRPRPVRCSCRR